MRFLELFLEQMTANKDATTGYSSGHEDETSARSLYSFQNVSYNPAIVNLLTQTPNVQSIFEHYFFDCIFYLFFIDNYGCHIAVSYTHLILKNMKDPYQK